ncbi:hypothetical protein K1T71_005364 [Dendrolimus kikuchii]|uniref:Uncharacterized protein n=1 Tax=Dendrolimus kikuchii TaxID=765133 RepID=A0ACC1D3T5_9NEOP|nr:hypothetical protein K1T71_005364 [Dendrolimus kikuchii]
MIRKNPYLLSMTEARQRVPKEQKQNEASPEVDEGPKYWDPLADGVKWIERYSDSLDKFFQKLPDFIGTLVATLAVFTFGSTLRGEWVVILVTALKQISGHTASTNVTAEEIFSMFTEQNLKMESFGTIFLWAHLTSFSIYFLSGGFLHWYFYVKRRDRAKEWKIQPNKWLTPELERHEILIGTMSLLIVNTFSAFLATYIINGNPSTIYYQFEEYGWIWFFLQFPIIFIYTDYTTYVLHRLYHTPFFYKHFHKLHHKYKAPTAFSVTAIHPVEILHVQLTMCLPLFTVPVHWIPFYTVAIYNYCHGIIDHSGINFKAQWWQPWQPDAEFHDQHHEFFHCNFGFNMSLWDKLHGTGRKTKYVYTEDTYHGEAPHMDTREGKSLLEKEPELIDIIQRPSTFSETDVKSN